MTFLPDLVVFFQIVLVDLAMAGDNAIIIGLAAAGLPAEQRHKAVFAGIIGATILRIFFAIFAVQLLQITGLLVAGGLLLLWVSWKMYRDLRHAKLMQDAEEKQEEAEKPVVKHQPKTLGSAVWQIIVADVSMSLDNVLGVAGIAREHITMLIVGLTLSILLMGLASSFVARLVVRFSWVGYLGLAVVFFTALKMIWDGAKPFLA